MGWNSWTESLFLELEDAIFRGISHKARFLLISRLLVRVQQGALDLLREPGDFHGRRVFRFSVQAVADQFLHLATYSAALSAAFLDCPIEVSFGHPPIVLFGDYGAVSHPLGRDMAREFRRKFCRPRAS